MGRLVLTRRTGERIKIGEDIWVEVLKVDRGKVMLACYAPPAMKIWREELLPQNNITTDIADNESHNDSE